MLTINEIRNVVNDVIPKYPVKKVSLFGSFAEGTADEESDIDILVEFFTTNVSLLTIYSMKDDISFILHREVDLIHAPLDQNSLININKVIDIYEQ